MTTLIFIIAIVIVALGAFDAASVAWGVDSRESIGDDHRR
jgi:hypothetical protein